MSPHPIRLRPDNFTPPSRTPWGGTRLMQRYKVDLGIRSVAPDAVVGESMYFETSGRDLVTSCVVSVERPGPEVVAHYS